MPTYHFQNKETSEVLEQFLKISELDEFLNNHPEFIQVVTAPAVVGTMGKNTPLKKKDTN
jgi:hypothetical protein